MELKTMPLKPHAHFPMPHPGAILAEAIEAMGVKKTDLAERLGVTRKALYDILAGTTGITAKTAIALEREVGSSAEFWLNLQSAFDLWQARKKPAIDNPHLVAAKAMKIRRVASAGEIVHSRRLVTKKGASPLLKKKG